MNTETLLNLLTEQPETDKTDETDYSTVTNAVFLRVLFGELTLERPIAVSFKGNPATVNKNSWFGHPYTDKTVFPEDSNNYTSFATFTPDDDGQYRRKKAQFAALHAIMLDDVGVKVDAERVTLAPSWIIETSPDNFQYGFMLAEPLRDATMATNLLDSVIAAGLCDPGANGACARIGRLPVAVNGKHDNFPCKLTEWQPSRRYSVQQLVDGLQIELKEKGKKISATKNTAADSGDEVHIPRAIENPVLMALTERGLYKLP